jgi:hypothetical protein
VWHTDTTIDIFVADVILRGTNGPELVRKLRKIQLGARVLFIGGFELAEFRSLR